MNKQAKTEQLQIRVTPQQKAEILACAKNVGEDMSSWVLRRVLPQQQEIFDSLLHDLYRESDNDKSFVFAEISDFLNKLTKQNFKIALAEPPHATLSQYTANYVAAMIEHTANAKGWATPKWVRTIPPLKEPSFGTDLVSLRLYLLLHSPLAFRRRNIFIDATVGDRV